MNFESYCKQAYNVGSPQPTAKRNLADHFPKTPTPSAKRKFEPDNQSASRPPKMPKVGDMDFEDLVKALQGAFKQNIEEATATLTGEIAGLRADIDKDKDATAILTDRVGTVEGDITDIKRQLQTLTLASRNDMENVKEAMLPDMEKIVTRTVNTQWQDVLASEVRKEEDKLLIYGQEWPTGCPVAQFRVFCKNSLKMEASKADSMVVKEVVKLGNPKNGRPAPQLVKLSSVSDRNDCLRLSGNLSGGITLDKCVPKRYREKYSSFKTLAWKIRVAKK